MPAETMISAIEPPDGQHAGPTEKPTFVTVSVNDGLPRWLKPSAAIAAVVVAVFGPLHFLGSWRERKGMHEHHWRNGGVRKSIQSKIQERN